MAISRFYVVDAPVNKSYTKTILEYEIHKLTLDLNENDADIACQEMRLNRMYSTKYNISSKIDEVIKSLGKINE